MDLYEQLDQRRFPDDQMEVLRTSVCDPEFVAASRDMLGVALALTIRSRAQSDPELAERWLDDGILTVYERVDQDDGTVLFNIEWSDEVIVRLVDASARVYDTVLADPGTYCADLL